MQPGSKFSKQAAGVFEMFGPPPQLSPSSSSDAASSAMQFAGGISGGDSAAHSAPHSSANLRQTITAAVNWRCGHAEYDTFISSLGLPPDLLESLAQVDQQSRLKMFRSTWQKKPDYPSSWIEKCLQRHWSSKGGGRGTPYQREMASVPQTPLQTVVTAAAVPMLQGTPM